MGTGAHGATGPGSSRSRRSPLTDRPCPAFGRVVGTYLAHLTADPHSSPPHTTSRVSRPALAGLAVDGKTLRGSRTGDTEVHLLDAVRHGDQIVVAQRQIAARSNEIPAFTPAVQPVLRANRASGLQIGVRAEDVPGNAPGNFGFVGPRDQGWASAAEHFGLYLAKLSEHDRKRRERQDEQREAGGN